MKKTLLSMIVLSASIAQPLYAGTIQNACLKSDRPASRATCQCIQVVADRALSQSDQSLAAKFFEDPHMAQEVRQSDNPSKERFWKRYKAFGELAGKNCS